MKKLQLYVSVALLMMAASAAGIHYVRSQLRVGDPAVVVTVQGSERSVRLPLYVQDFASTNELVAPDEINMLPADTTFGRRRYIRRTPQGIELRILSAVLMGSDRSSLHRPEYCLVGAGFQIVSERWDEIEVTGARGNYTIPIKTLVADLKGQKAYYVYWYVSDDHLANRPLQWMSRMAWKLGRTGELSRYAYISCLAPIPPKVDEASAYQSLKEFLALVAPEVMKNYGPDVSEEEEVLSPINLSPVR